MTRYQLGFMNKCAEHGVDGRLVLRKLAQDAGAGSSAPPPAAPKKPGWFATQYNSAKDWAKANPAGAGAIGGGVAGAGVGALIEALRKRRNPNDRKDYLKAVLLGLTMGAGAGAAGGYFGPGLYEKAKPGLNAAKAWGTDVWDAMTGKGSNTAPLIEAARAAREAKKQAK